MDCIFSLPFIAFTFLTFRVAEGDSMTLGFVESDLQQVLRDAGGVTSDVYVDTGGLYLLQESIPCKGQVREMCALGYTTMEFLKYYLVPNTTEIYVKTLVRPFVYIILFRPNSEEKEYSIVHKPAVLHHDFLANCLRRSEGFHWQVDIGDRIGVFIPSRCIRTNDTKLQNVFVSNEVKERFTTLCPSHISLIQNASDNSSALIANDSSLSLDDIKDFSFNIDEFLTTSVRMNMNVTIEQGSDTVVTMAVVIAGALVLTMVGTATSALFVCRHRRKMKKALSVNEHAPSLHQDPHPQISSSGLVKSGNETQMQWAEETPLNKTALLSEVSLLSEKIVLSEECSLGKPPLSAGCRLSRMNDGYETVACDTDYDYSMAYFKPATEEDVLFRQLSMLPVPVIAVENLRLCEVLGSGEFGTVHRGVWLRPSSHSEEAMEEEEVAVKLMDSRGNEEDRVKFLQEAAIMGQFNHPNIIRILGIIPEGKLQIVVNLMSDDLRKHLISILPKRQEVVPPELGPTLLSFSRQIAFGMLYFTTKSFVHRDLAARNILVSTDGTSCKIADFGLSRELQSESYYISHGGKIPVKWTAPEALLYHRYSIASDVWSFGCVLYEIWSMGCKPFHNVTNAEAMKLLSSGYRLPPPPGCPRMIYDIMIKCWHPDENKRCSFLNIVVDLQQPDFKILNEWTSPIEKLSGTLGAGLDQSKHLFLDLQKMYLCTKEPNSASRKAVCGSAEQRRQSCTLGVLETSVNSNVPEHSSDESKLSEYSNSAHHILETSINSNGLEHSSSDGSKPSEYSNDAHIYAVLETSFNSNGHEHSLEASKPPENYNGTYTVVETSINISTPEHNLDGNKPPENWNGTYSILETSH